MTALLNSQEGLMLTLSAWALVALIACWVMHHMNYRAIVQGRRPRMQFEHYVAWMIWPVAIFAALVLGALFAVCYPPARLAEWLSRHVAAQAERERERLQASTHRGEQDE